MDKALKQRMVGAIVLIALGVIFIPMLLDGGSRDGSRTVELDIPEPPEQDYRSRLLPLEEKEAEDGARDDDRGRVTRRPSVPAQEPAAEATGSPETAPASTRSEQTTPSTPAEPAATAPGQEESEPEEPAATDESRSREREMPLGNWFIQVGSFSQQENADDLRDQLRGEGYTAFVETSTVEGKTIHRVKVGPEMDRARAERVRDEIQSAMDLKGIVVSEP